MFKTRLLSGIVLVLILLATVITGGPVLFALIWAASIIGMTEQYKVLKMEKTPLAFVGYVIASAYYLLLFFGKTELIIPLGILLLLLLMATFVFTYPKFRSENITMAFFGFFYVAVMLSYVYQTRMLPNGKIMVWLIFLSSWGCDTCAYCVGVLFGKRKLAPVLSPKKSIEGGIGGVVGAALLGVIYAACMNHFLQAEVSVWLCALICGVGGVISQIGDLSASGIKRNHEIKDYGKLIPGHGGILDRFDSVIFTAPIIYYLTVFLG